MLRWSLFASNNNYIFMQSFLETGIKADTNTTQKLDRPRIRIQSQPSKREKTFSSNSFYPTIK